MADAFDDAWTIVKAESYDDRITRLIDEASEYCEDVFMAMESHGLTRGEAVRQVADLVGIDEGNLFLACLKYMKSGGQTKGFGLRGRV